MPDIIQFNPDSGHGCSSEHAYSLLLKFMNFIVENYIDDMPLVFQWEDRLTGEWNYVTNVEEAKRKLEKK